MSSGSGGGESGPADAAAGWQDAGLQILAAHGITDRDSGA